MQVATIIYGTQFACIGWQILYHWVTREEPPQVSILYIASIVYMCQFQSSSSSHPSLFGIHTFVLYVCVCFCFEMRSCLVTWVVSDSLQPYGPWPARLLCPWDSPGKNTGVGCHFLSFMGFWCMSACASFPRISPCLLRCWGFGWTQEDSELG